MNEQSALSQELRDFARVVVRALGVVVQFWSFSVDRYPSEHPYRMAAQMVISYLNKRYDL